MKRFCRCCLLIICLLSLGGEVFAAKISAPKLQNATNTSEGITLKWSPVKKAKGYYIYRKTGSEKYKRLATVKGKTRTSFTDKKVVYKKTYTYCVKAYTSNALSKASVRKKIKRTVPAYAAAYAKTLSKMVGSSDSLYYTLAFIDKDQVPELIIWDAEHVENGFKFYQYVKGKVKKAGTLYSDHCYYIEYKRKKNLIYYWYYNEEDENMEKQYSMYKISGGKLKKCNLQIEKLYNNPDDTYMIGHKKRIEDDYGILVGFDIDGVKVCKAGIERLISDYKRTLSENIQIPVD